jgi:hypothetical protein
VGELFVALLQQVDGRFLLRRAGRLTVLLAVVPILDPSDFFVLENAVYASNGHQVSSS